MKIRTFASCALIGSALVFPQISRASLINLGADSFTPAAPVITFDGMSGQTNPSVTVAAGSLGNVTVSFAGSFVGQTIGGGFPKTLTDHTPTGPLTLGSGTTRVVNDGAPGATSPVLSGNPLYNGPISMIFSQSVAAVGLKGGYFDAIGATTIEAYDENGLVLGSIVNSVLGFEFYGLADSTGANLIKGISFFITGNEPAGFQIDNITFGAVDVIKPDVITNVPEQSATVALLGLGLLAFVSLRRCLR